jgi:hypothetical protein
LVVFDPAKPVVAQSLSAGAMRTADEKAIEGRWSFHAEGHGAKGRVIAMDAALPKLSDWSAIDGAADLAGTGRYGKQFGVEGAWLGAGRKVVLDLGEVHDAAIVSVNGVRFPTLLFAPFTIDVTKALHPGDNALSVEVVNAPQNAMVDAGAAPPMRVQPMPAGLLGPVKLESIAQGLR